MTDITLNHMTNGQNVSVANTNFDTIQDNINNHSLQKDGGNNILFQDLDLNGHNLLNAGTLNTHSLVLAGQVISTAELVTLDPSTLAPIFASPSPIGNITPNTGAFTTLSVTSTTNSTSPTTGAEVISGGLGVGKDIICGGAYHGAAYITSGQVDGTPVGVSTASTGKFTTLQSSGATTLGATTASSLDSTPVGATTPSTGKFTNLTVTGTLTGIPGRLLAVRQLSGSGTYTPTTGTNSILVYVTGGGGGGGSTAACSASQTAMGAGGASGATAISYLTSAFSGVSYSVGALGAGAGAGGSAGSTGGTSTFSTISAAGGPGGAAGAATANTSNYFAQTTGAVATASGGNLLNLSGSSSHYGLSLAGTFISGSGNPSVWGGGGRGVVNNNSAGNAATNPGSGGGGAGTGTSGAAQAGGNGAAGTIIIYEYA